MSSLFSCGFQRKRDATKAEIKESQKMREESEAAEADALRHRPVSNVRRSCAASQAPVVRRAQPMPAYAKRLRTLSVSWPLLLPWVCLSKVIPSRSSLFTRQTQRL